MRDALRRAALGPWSRGEKNALVAFLMAVTMWVGPGIAASIAGPASDVVKLFEKRIPEGIASLSAALLLFVLPTSWKDRMSARGACR